MRAIASMDSEDRSMWTVARIAVNAQRTISAADIYLTDDPLADQSRHLSALLDDPDELVTDRSGKPGLALYDLKVSIADARLHDPYQRLARRFRHRHVSDFDRLFDHTQCFHQNVRRDSIYLPA